MEGKGLCGWARVRPSWEGGYPVLTCGEMWAGSSVLLSSVAIPFPKCGLCPTEAGWKGKQDSWQGLGEKELRLTKSLWCGPQCRPSHTWVKIAVT